ncbi:energy-coupling factor transport system permease protein [Saccharopolyspora antimicrobica]|uniref:Energy-coupling factor transport system permease protein n=1 Tax=Saccharopolyspora antimicrobica TaxID=455193 RepID=A0A1I5C5Z8_9PSEU|nr:energy-coupling factor transport system permease protein [Saccharopolyspora antimicrobica]SFN82357.1 energy-coupling factor transport system permease protein [Saccharopolyspora antimicrobica]
MTGASPQLGSLALGEPAPAGPAGPARGWVLDPRTAVVILLAASITIMAPGGIWFVPAALVAATLLAISERAWRRAIGVPLAAAAAAGVAFLLPLVAPWPVLGFISVMAGFALRLVAVGGIAVHLARTIPPTRFTAALRAARIPSAFTVSGAVLLRFVPTIISEARAVHDAMRLRGLGGGLAVLRHPVRSIEYFTVPLMASSLRAAEDLSASSLLRGLGSQPRPTSMHPPRFGLPDAVAAVVVVVLGAATVLWGYGH